MKMLKSKLLDLKEKENNTISYRLHGKKETTTITKEDFLEKLRIEIATKALTNQ